MYCDICIIGAGASGLAAAVTAAEQSSEQIIILEGKRLPGRKIAASGNGRCNLTNVNAEGYEQVKDFFQHLGLFIRQEEEGRCYPASGNSGDVLKALTRQIDCLGVKLYTDYRVETIEKKDMFLVSGMVCEKGKKNRKFTVKARKLLIAAGGKSMAELGTSGDGANFARKMGHSVTALVPVLTAVETVEKPQQQGYRGVRAKGRVYLDYRGETIFSEQGEVQFTEDGISGICVFNLSRYMMIPKGKNFRNGFEDYQIRIDLLPDVDEKTASSAVAMATSAFVERMQRMEKESFNIEDGVVQILLSFVREGLAREIGRRTVEELCKENVPLCQAQSVAQVALQKMKCFYMNPSGARGWNFAQVTKGGVPFEEVSIRTMESKLVPNLYFAGEVMDFDGPCGGYNLQNAWLTGIRCGKAMAEKRKK